MSVCQAKHGSAQSQAVLSDSINSITEPSSSFFLQSPSASLLCNLTQSPYLRLKLNSCDNGFSLFVPVYAGSWVWPHP